MNRHARRLASSGSRIRRYLILGLFFVLLTGVTVVQPATRQPSSPDAALTPDSWITVNKDYSSQRYVDLDQITPANVGGLKEVCEIQLNQAAWFNSGLLMVGHTIYVNTLRSTFAFDAATCDLLWRHDIQFTPSLANISSRGSGYLDGRIFRGTADGRVIALDAKTGTPLWEVQAADPTRNEAFVAAPIAWDGKVFIGIVTADLGVRGRLQAFDAATGKELWLFHTVPIGIEIGAGTWHNPPGSPPAGGAFWTSFSLDRETGEVFGPVSNPFPDFAQENREGSNLYTNSVISLNAATGDLRGFYQAIAGDDHDWDLGAPPTLYRTPAGKDMLAIAGKDGYVIGLDRECLKGGSKSTCKPVFKAAGTTTTNPVPPLDDTLHQVCPGALGGAEWNGTAYHPGLGILYTGMGDFCYYYSTRIYSEDGKFWESKESKDPGTVRADFSQQPRGHITAMDGATGKVLWQYDTDGQILAGLVPTRSGLLFGGDVRGNLLALDAKTGKLLESIDTGGALNNGLISYAVDGRQYVAAAAGGLSLNTAGVSGPLRVVVYGLQGGGKPKVVKLDRSPIMPIPTADEAVNDAEAFGFVCGGCHGFAGQGFTYPPLTRHAELGDPETLADFLSTVPPPMPILYPGLLEKGDVEQIAAFLKRITAGSAAYKPPKTEGSEEWQKVYSVLTNPRCINCHTSTNYPRQRDIRYPHIYSVVRGVDDKGAPLARCTSCHGLANDKDTGIPGAACAGTPERPCWQLAPLAMAWESAPGVPMTGPELCGMLKDRLRNGDRGLDDLLQHVEARPDEPLAPLLLWAWSPGTRWNGEPRTVPPLSHAEFVAAFAGWVKNGGPCPTQESGRRANPGR